MSEERTMVVQVSGKRGERQAYWRQVMESFCASGETVQHFCREHGLSPASFYQWRKKLMATEGDTAHPGFIDLGELSTRTSAGRLEIRLDLGGGLMLQVVRG